MYHIHIVGYVTLWISTFFDVYAMMNLANDPHIKQDKTVTQGYPGGL